MIHRETIAQMKRWATGAISFSMLIKIVAAAPKHPIAVDTITVPNLTRYNQFVNSFGGNTTTTDPVNFGMLIYNLTGIYPDAIGQVAYVIMFAMPFVMMWIVQSDMTLPAIVGILFSLYIFLKVPEQYILFGVGCFAISITALLWSLYKRY